MLDIKKEIENGKKVFVLDTNVLLYAPMALEAFEDNILIIADVVLDELDKHKSSPGEVGFNAREVARKLDKYREDTKNGDLIAGYKLPNGGYIKVELNHEDVKVPKTWVESADTRLLKVALGLRNDYKLDNQSVILVSNDLFVRIKASVLEINTEEFMNQSVARDENEYTGRDILYTNRETIDRIYMIGEINNPFKNYYITDKDGNKFEDAVNNQYFVLKAADDQSSIITIYKNKTLTRVKDVKTYGIEPITSGQVMAFDALNDSVKNTPLAAIKGPAGTGKTLLAIAAGLNAVNNGDFRRVLYLRANTVLDDEIGFLPGTEEEKLEWLIRPVKDNLEVLFENLYKGMKYAEISRKIEDLFEKGIIKVESVGFMRGRSLNNMFIIIDEAQNLTPQQVKTLLSRAGKNTKVILMGDPEQIDKPYLDYNNNGLSYACDRLKGSKLMKQVTMLDSESERSPLSFEVIKSMR